MLKKIAIKIAGLVIVCIAINYIYILTMYKNDLQVKSDKVLEVNRLNNTETEVIYISDCSNTNSIDSDSNKLSISENINLFFPSLKIKSIDMAASHAGIFKDWIYLFKFKKIKPKCLIVTIGLRSFNSSWINSDLETALQESTVMMKPYPSIVNRFLISIKGYDYQTKEDRQSQVQKDWRSKKLNFPYKTKYNTLKEWDSTMAQGTYLLADGSWDFDKISLACHYIKAFAFNIDELNPRVKDFDKIVNWAEKNQIKLYLNLIPENIQFADSLVSKDLLFLMRRNAAFIIKRYDFGNCKVINNLELLKGNEFTEKNWTTEHYSCKGRMYIAKSVALEIKNDLRSNFISRY